MLLIVPLYTEAEKADFRYTFSPEGHRLNLTYPVALEKTPEGKDVISQCCVQVLDKETGEPVEGAEVQLIRTIWFLPLPISWGKTDEYGRCVFDRLPGRDKVEVRVRAEGYEELLESATWMETYFPVEEQTGDVGDYDGDGAPELLVFRGDGVALTCYSS